MYKITQENYRMLNREHIYTGRLKYMCRIRLSFESFVSHEFQRNAFWVNVGLKAGTTPTAAKRSFE